MVMFKVPAWSFCSVGSLAIVIVAIVSDMNMHKIRVRTVFI